jgi:O-methyltransferase
MDNVFITDEFQDYQRAPLSKTAQLFNRILRAFGAKVSLEPPPKTGTMTNVEQRMNMYHLGSQVLFYNVPSDFVELGCNEGLSAVLFQRLINHYDPTRVLHLYDSFEGLPEATRDDGDTPYKKGQMATTPAKLKAAFAHVGLPLPQVHPGWFDQTLPGKLPEKIAFAHLDGDFYKSVKISLETVYPRLSKGAVCLVDDYCNPEVYDGWNDLPGVKKACDEFLEGKPETVSVLYAGHYAHGYFRKL